MRVNKHNNTKITIDGITFDSKLEAKRYQELKLLEMAGKIKDLELQVPYTLLDSFTYKGKKERPIKYYADFRYLDLTTCKRIVEDVKGFRTDVYKLKRKMLLSRYPDINFVEVSK